MDGFSIKKRFYCKELGILRIGDAAAQSVFFDIGVKWAELGLPPTYMNRSCDWLLQTIKDNKTIEM